MVGKEFLYFFINFLAAPSLLIAIFGMVGSIVQKKTASQVIASTLKTMMGFLILAGGAAMLNTSLNGFDATFRELFGGNSIVIPNNDGIGGLAASMGMIGTWASVIMLIAMCGNILLALCTKFKYIYLSGHVLFYICICVAVTSRMLGLNPENAVDAVIIIISGSCIVSMYMVLSPAICQKYMRKITGSNDVAIGHTSSFTYFLAGLIGDGIHKIKKGNVKKSDELNLPKNLGWLRNRSLMITGTMTIIYIAVFISGWAVLGKDWFTTAQLNDAGEKIRDAIFKETDSIPVQMFIKAVTFAAGMEVILFGVRTTLNELIPAFKGISDKVIKGSKPALDCPVVFPYSQNGMLLGFFGALAGGILMVGLSILLVGVGINSYIIIFGTISIYFTGATAGVFGDANGGVWGALIGGFVDGFIVTLLPYLFTFGNLLSSDILSKNMTWGDTDFGLGLFIGMWKWFGLHADVSKWILLGTSLGTWMTFLSIGLVGKLNGKRKIIQQTDNNVLQDKSNDLKTKSKVDSKHSS